MTRTQAQINIINQPRFNPFLTKKKEIGSWLLLVLFWLGLSLMLAYRAMELNEGNFVFPLDDSYIHLAIAKKIANSGNWGPSPFQFQFSSSSPAFSLMLAGLGGRELASLFINLIFGGLFLWIALGLSRQSSLNAALRFGLTALVSSLIPLHLLLLLGMEHLAHLFFSVLFVKEASLKLQNTATHPNGLLVISAMLMCFFRYEGLFLIAAYFGVGFLMKKYKNVIFTSLFATLPLALLGAYMLANNGSFLPISILGKASGTKLLNGAIVEWLNKAVQNLYENPFILSLALGNLLLLMSRIRENLRIWILLFLFGALFHILFAEVGGYRYEAYLIGIGLLSFTQIQIKGIDMPLLSLFQKQVLLVLLSLFLFPLIIRTAFFTANYPLFCQNIYQQPIQAGNFLEEYYWGESVGMNDIGAGSFFGEIQLTDLVGIGDQLVHSYRKADLYDAQTILQIAEERKMRIAIIHDIWLEEWRPSEWIKVAEWTIPDNLICADESLSFYACNEKEVAYLKKALESYSKDKLPPRVKFELFVE